MTTVKTMSTAGRLADAPTDSYRTSRAAGENIIPAVTNTAEILTQALPQLEGKLAVVALNVPVVDGSTVDLTIESNVETTVEEVNAAIAAKVEAEFQGLIEYVADPIVSSDV